MDDKNNQTPTPLEEMTLAQLKEEATKLNVAGVEDFTTRKQLLNVIQMAQGKPPVGPTANTVLPGENVSQDRQAWTGKREIMMNKLWGQLEAGEKTRVLIPLEGKEKMGVIQVVAKGTRREFVAVSGAVWAKAFNGYVWMVPKGTYTDVPNQIAEAIEREQQQTARAGEQWDVNRIDPETGRPVADQL